MGLTADPEFVKIYRHEKAIPQYRVGHADRLAAIEKELEKFPDLVMTGNAFRGVSLNDLDDASRRKLEQMPDPEMPLEFGDAVRARRPAGGNAEAAHRTATLMHLANIAFLTGRKIRFDPDKEEIIGDEEANRLVNQPMRAPWHL